jgi:trigger factor
MTATLETVSALRRRLKIEVPVDEVKAERDRVISNYAKMAKVDGFRPGKAPREKVATMYAAQIDEELQQTLLSKSFRDAITQNSLKLASDPSVEEVKFEKDQPFTFSALVDLQPEFKLPEYKGIAVKAQDTEVTDAEVEKAIGELLDREATFDEVTGRALAAEDYAVLTFTSTIDGQPLGEAVPAAKALGESKGFWFRIGDESFLPEFSAVLPGLLIGDKTTIDVNFDGEHYLEELRGKKAVFQVTVDGIRSKKLPEFNDELAQRLASIPAEELKSRLRTGLTSRKQREAEGAKRDEVVNQLLNASEFDLPESVVANYTRSVVREIVNENRQRGVAPEVLEQDKEKISEAAAAGGRSRAKLRYLLLEIAKAEKLTATSQDMLNEVNHIARRADMTAKAVLKQLKKNDSLAALEEDIVAGKALDFVVAHATVTP